MTASTETIIRRTLMAILVIGLGGTVAELLLLKHFDGFWQLVPLALVCGALLILGWYAVSRAGAALRALQVVMWLCIAAGFVGAVQHFIGNVGYAKDSNPSLEGRELYWEALRGSTPSLAPGTMLEVGLVGLLLIFRHPALERRVRGNDSPNQRT